MISSPPLKSLPSRVIWLSTGLSTKWATKVVYDACKIQIGQPCLPAILLNTFLLDSALFHFSCPDSTWVSSQLWKHFIGMLVILSSWSISQKCKIRICANLLGADHRFCFHSFIILSYAGGCWGLRCYDCEGAHCTDPANLQVLSHFYRKRFITKIKILKKNSETLNNNLRRPTAMEEKNSAWSFGWRVSLSSEKRSRFLHSL